YAALKRPHQAEDESLRPSSSSCGRPPQDKYLLIVYAEGDHRRFQRFSFCQICAHPDKVRLPGGQRDIIGNLDMGFFSVTLPNQVPLLCHNENIVVTGPRHFTPTEG